jgi:hypothetical protein
MEHVRGQIAYLRVSQEEGGRDWALSISKVMWCGIWLLFPVSLFRLLNDLFGLVVAICGVLLLAVLFRLFGPLTIVMLDELLSRIFPSMRSAIRMGIVRIHDFRLRTDEGKEIACLMKGDLVGAGPVEGDIFELEGQSRQGTFWIRRGINEATGSILAARSLHSGWVLFCTGIVLTLLLLYLTGVFDQVIYSFIEKLMISEG